MSLVSRGQILRQVRRLNAELDEATREDALRSIGSVSCAPGCSYCCHQKIVGGAFEGVPIYLYLKARGAWTPALREHIVAIDRAQTARTHRGALLARIPCAFLEETTFGDGRCTIYPVRPVCCVQTLARGEPSACGTPDGRDMFQILLRAYDQRILESGRNSLRLFPPPRGGMLFATLAGAVLLAEAALEGLPPPEVHTMVPPPGIESYDKQFDKVATIEDEAP